MKYDVVYYINNKRIIRSEDFETFEEANEYAKNATIAFDIKHVVEKKEEPSLEDKISSAIKSGLITGVIGLFAAAILGMGRRD